MCIERWHVSRSAFCSAALHTRPRCNRFTMRSYTRARGRQVHSRAYRHARGIFLLFLSLPLILSSFTSLICARFLLLRSRELAVVSMFRALLHFFVYQNNHPEHFLEAKIYVRTFEFNSLFEILEMKEKSY